MTPLTHSKYHLSGIVQCPPPHFCKTLLMLFSCKMTWQALTQQSSRTSFCRFVHRTNLLNFSMKQNELFPKIFFVKQTPNFSKRFYTRVCQIKAFEFGYIKTLGFYGAGDRKILKRMAKIKNTRNPAIHSQNLGSLSSFSL